MSELPSPNSRIHLMQGGVYLTEMKNYRQLTDVEFDRLVEGVGPACDPTLGELNTFVQDVRAAYLRPMSRTVEMDHIAEMVKEAGSGTWRASLAKQLEGLKASLGPFFRAPSLKMRRILLANLAGSALGKAVLMLTAAAAATTTGLAATGSLPPPLQAVVISAAHNLGIAPPPPTPPPAQRPAPPLPTNPSPEAPVADPNAPPVISHEPELPSEPPAGGTASAQAPGYPGGFVTTKQPSRRDAVFSNGRLDSTGGSEDRPDSNSSPASGKDAGSDLWNSNDEPERGNRNGSQQSSASESSRGSWSWYSQDSWNSWQGSWRQSGRR